MIDWSGLKALSKARNQAPRMIWLAKRSYCACRWARAGVFAQALPDGKLMLLLPAKSSPSQDFLFLSLQQMSKACVLMVAYVSRI